MTMELCPCGCDQPVLKGHMYADVDRCKFRAHRKRLQARAEAAGLPARLTMETIEAASTTHGGSGNRQTRRKRPRKASRPGVTVYLPDPVAAEFALGHLLLSSQPLLAQVADAITAALARRAQRLSETDRHVPVAALASDRANGADRRGNAGGGGVAVPDREVEPCPR